MSNYEMEDLKKIHYALEDLWVLNVNLQKCISSLEFSSQSPFDLKVDDSKLILKCFGVTAQATPYLVQAHERRYFIEYIFFVEKYEVSTPVCCFYLSRGGRLVLNPDDKDGFLDFDNRYVNNLLIEILANQILGSKLFEVTDIS